MTNEKEIAVEGYSNNVYQEEIIMKKDIAKEICVTAATQFKRISIPKGCFCSDTFVCEKCGLRGIYKVYGDTKTCPDCGGTMHRQ